MKFIFILSETRLFPHSHHHHHLHRSPPCQGIPVRDSRALHSCTFRGFLYPPLTAKKMAVYQYQKDKNAGPADSPAFRKIIPPGKTTTGFTGSPDDTGQKDPCKNPGHRRRHLPCHHPGNCSLCPCGRRWRGDPVISGHAVFLPCSHAGSWR